MHTLKSCDLLTSLPEDDEQEYSHASIMNNKAIMAMSCLNYVCVQTSCAWSCGWTTLANFNCWKSLSSNRTTIRNKSKADIIYNVKLNDKLIYNIAALLFLALVYQDFSAGSYRVICYTCTRG